MTLREFIAEYCRDIWNAALEKRSTKKDGIFSYDNIIHNPETDSYEKIIYDDVGNVIKLDDIIQLTLEDFSKVYKFSSSLVAYKKYLDAYEILEGKDIIEQYLNDVEKVNKQFSQYKDSITSIDLNKEMGLSW